MDWQELAQRIYALRPCDQTEVGIRSFALGAVYAAAMASKHGYPRQRVDYPAQFDSEVDAVASRMASGELPDDGLWLAGYYLNDAIFRIDVAFECVARYRARLDGCKRVDKLNFEALKTKMPPAFRDPWEIVRREEVNPLKHRNPEQITTHLKGQGMLYDETRLSETLSALVKSVEWVFSKE